MKQSASVEASKWRYNVCIYPICVIRSLITIVIVFGPVMAFLGGAERPRRGVQGRSSWTLAPLAFPVSTFFPNRFSRFQLVSVSTVMNQSSIMPFVFRNYSLPCDRQSQYLGSCKYTLFESVRASGAAPTVFQEFCLDGMIHQVNNSVTLLRIRSRRRRRKGKQRRHVSLMTQLRCVVFCLPARTRAV